MTAPIPMGVISVQGMLTRTYDADGPTFGSLLLTNDGPDMFSCFTLELPWFDDRAGVSCIPEGQYSMIRHSSPAHPNVWQVNNVPGRTEILIHNGNVESDSLGCIIVGRTSDPDGRVLGKPAVLESDAALGDLMQFTEAWPDGWNLTITHGE